MTDVAVPRVQEMRDSVTREVNVIDVFTAEELYQMDRTGITPAALVSIYNELDAKINENLLGDLLQGQSEHDEGAQHC
jgi:hypothetical protein